MIVWLSSQQKQDGRHRGEDGEVGHQLGRRLTVDELVHLHAVPQLKAALPSADLAEDIVSVVQLGPEAHARQRALLEMQRAVEEKGLGLVGQVARCARAVAPAVEKLKVCPLVEQPLEQDCAQVGRGVLFAKDRHARLELKADPGVFGHVSQLLKGHG